MWSYPDLGGLALFVVTLACALIFGIVALPLETVFGVVINEIAPGSVEETWSKGRYNMVWNIRFPRALLALMVGAGLAIVGASLQAVTHQLLADPHLLGISSGGPLGRFASTLHTGLFLGL